MTTTPPPRGTPPAPGRRARRDRESGQAAIEFIGFVPILLLVALAAVQLGLAAHAASQAGTAARAAARAASQHEGPDPVSTGRQALSGWLADDAGFRQARAPGEVTVTATVRIPSVIPGVEFGEVRRSSTMPRARD
ncbi:pilus assembly protein [Streptomyces durbertensis]|uniref:Pilus assembly protein n=1 Tax=Streptomyces durbertensis TaxID=2448886 RepID=A0ABR6EMD3_9ACTN|nr:TadE family protein [Streptomyces durbertensis]MBB1246520.1 pilus assembly protein [Streptomyces durbertensis]